MRTSRKDKKTVFLKKVLNELFKRVGFYGYDQKLVDKYPNNWYVQREWTEEQEESYKQWFAEQHQKAFKSTKEYARSEAGWFLFSYGWKVKGEKDNTDSL